MQAIAIERLIEQPYERFLAVTFALSVHNRALSLIDLPRRQLNPAYRAEFVRMRSRLRT